MRVLIAALLLMGAATAMAESSDSLAQCDNCHGVDGVARWPEVPNISGLPEVVIANALYDFKGHERPCRKLECAGEEGCPDDDMCGVTRHLSDGQIDGLARRYAAQPFGPTANEFDVELAERGRKVHGQACGHCHTRGGSDPLDQASILKGQNSEYIRRALGDYVEGRRLGEHAMVEEFRIFTTEDIEALVNFYASTE